jgi:hypothetical protein
MPRRRDTIDPRRLLDAADAALCALDEYAAATGRAADNPLDLYGSDYQPRALDGFEIWEVEQATLMLVRMGFLNETRSAEDAA